MGNAALPRIPVAGWGTVLLIHCNSATERMMTYKPAEHEETTSVAPLLQFFELAHIGDTIQSIVQVFFDKEMVCISFTSQPLLGLTKWKRRLHTSTGRTS